MISRIECSQSSPTASVLGRLTGGLRAVLSELLGDAQAPVEPPRRRAQQKVWGDPVSGYRCRQVGARGPCSGCEMMEVEIPTNAHLGYPHRDDRPYRQRPWLVEGAPRVDYDERTFHL